MKIALALVAVLAVVAVSAADDSLGRRALLQKSSSGCAPVTQSLLDSAMSDARVECLHAGVKGCSSKKNGECIKGCFYELKAVCPSRAAIMGAFDKWNAALKTLDPEKVADRYTSTAVLLPTLSNTPRNTRAKIVDYFVDFLKKKPVGEFQTIDGSSPNYYILGDNAVALAGIAKFTLTGDDGSKSEVLVRKTFVFEKQGKDWLIAEHHSSVMPEGTPAQTTEQVLAMFNKWNAALQTLDPNKVADRYTKDAVLLPTLSNKPRNTRAEIVDYFVDFLKKKPVGVFQTIDGSSPNVKNLAPGVVSLSGIAKFTLTDDKGAKSDVSVRKTFIFTKVGDDWLISEHQSSQMPEPM